MPEPVIKLNNPNKKSSPFQTIVSVISQRKSIREYSSYEIPTNLVKQVIKLACRAPSWYGLEPWFILAIKNQETKRELHALFNHQKQVLNCSHLFLVLSYKGTAFNWETKIFKQKVLWKFDRLTEETYPNFCQKSLQMFQKKNHKKIDIWAKQQCFILLQNFLLLWTSLNVATSPMGGFQERKIINYLEKYKIISPNCYNLAISFAAGYPTNESLWDKEIKSHDWKKSFKVI